MCCFVVCCFRANYCNVFLLFVLFCKSKMLKFCHLLWKCVVFWKTSFAQCCVWWIAVLFWPSEPPYPAECPTFTVTFVTQLLETDRLWTLLLRYGRSSMFLWTHWWKWVLLLSSFSFPSADSDLQVTPEPPVVLSRHLDHIRVRLNVTKHNLTRSFLIYTRVTINHCWERLKSLLVYQVWQKHSKMTLKSKFKHQEWISETIRHKLFIFFNLCLISNCFGGLLFSPALIAVVNPPLRLPGCSQSSQWFTCFFPVSGRWLDEILICKSWLLITVSIVTKTCRYWRITNDLLVKY